MSPITEEERYTDHVHPWEEIVKYVSLNQVDKLRRNKKEQEIYQKWIDETLIEYGTIENFLIKEKVKFKKDKDILILPNDFPYSVDPGIEHILIWSKEALNSNFIEATLKDNFGVEWEWIYFVNPPEFQSVKRLPHVHVFMRKIQ